MNSGAALTRRGSAPPYPSTRPKHQQAAPLHTRRARSSAQTLAGLTGKRGAGSVTAKREEVKMAKTTKQVAESIALKSRDVTTYAKKYGLLPTETFADQPMWEKHHIQAFLTHRSDMAAGLLCEKCGQYTSDAQPAEILATDEPGEVEGE